MGQVLQQGLLQGREPVGWQDYRAEASVHNKLAEIWGFAESDRGRFDQEVLGGWIEERMWKPSLRIRWSLWRPG